VYDPKRGYPTVVPCVLYNDFSLAVPWLRDVLGAREIVRAALPSGWVGHIEMELDGFVILLGRRGGQFGGTASVIQVFVPDIVAACARATDAGGAVLAQPGERPWGVLQATVADPEGQRWVLTQYLRDVDPAQWYGTVLSDFTTH
jgi:PhnB protein